MLPGQTLHKFFSEVRQKASEKAETCKAMASEMLMVYPVVRHFAYSTLENLGGLELQLLSFYVLGYALDLLHAAKLGPINTVEFQAAISLQANLLQRAYGTENSNPSTIMHTTFHCRSRETISC